MIKYIEKLNGRLMRYLFDALLLVVLSYVIWIGYQLYPRTPIRVDAIVIDKTEVTQGGEICFQTLGEKLMAIPVHVTLDLVDGQSFSLVSYDSNIPPGIKFPLRCVTIPYHIVPRAYKLRWTGVYQVTFLSHYIASKDSDWFTVKKDELKEGAMGKQGIQGKIGATGATGKTGKDFWGK
jgi:hypothetical protein